VANIYGIADNPTLPAIYGTVSAGDVTLTADTETTWCTTGVIKANFEGDYYPMISGVLVAYLGGTKPNALTIAYKLGSGSDVVTYVVDPGQLVNSAKLVIPFVLIGPCSATAWFPTGSTINITALGTAQASTAKNVGSFALVQLLRGPNI
jgi:hypothetical protein